MVDNNFPSMMGQPGIPTGQPQGNPLAKHLRQPKIYIKLPSNGKYWPKGSIEIPETGEIPVYAMTAKDEIAFKTPDALLNGQATVDVIQSCVPSIKDAWHTPSIDLDTLLVAIRMASFGETIDMTTKIPDTQITKDFTFNLQNLYDKYISTEFVDTFHIEGFTVQIKPVSYKTATTQSIKAFEQQRIFGIVNDESIDDTVKIERFQKSFSKLTEINVNILIDSVVALQPDDSDTPVTNPAHIREFLENCEAKTFNAIQKHISEQKDKFTQKPVEVAATPEELEQGAPEKYEIPITFDQSNFFASGS
jgi:hypothetical protein